MRAPAAPIRSTQATLAGFGWHAVPHVASAVVTRGYTPGVLTAPTVVVPFALWARSRLRRAGVPVAPTARAAALFGPLVVVGAHVAASVCSGSPTGGGRDAVPEILRDPCRSGPRLFDVLVRGR